MQNLIKRIHDICSLKKAEDIKILYIRKQSAFWDWMFILTARNQNHAQSICDHITYSLKKEENLLPFNVEGYKLAHWILIDYSKVLINIFLPQIREYYNLEEIWTDAEDFAL